MEWPEWWVQFGFKTFFLKSASGCKFRRLIAKKWEVGLAGTTASERVGRVAFVGIKGGFMAGTIIQQYFT
jgi:hypothetical protein